VTSSGTDVQVSGPQGGCPGQLVSDGAHGMQCLRGAPGVDRVGSGGEGGVEGVGDAYGEGVADLPQGADHVRVAGELERGGQVNGLVDQVGRGAERRPAGRQVGQPGPLEPDRRQASDGERVGVVITQQQQALGRIDRVTAAVAGEVRRSTAAGTVATG